MITTGKLPKHGSDVVGVNQNLLNKILNIVNIEKIKVRHSCTYQTKHSKVLNMMYFVTAIRERKREFTKSDCRGEAGVGTTDARNGRGTKLLCLLRLITS